MREPSFRAEFSAESYLSNENASQEISPTSLNSSSQVSIRLKNLKSMIRKKSSLSDCGPDEITFLIRYCETRSDARYALVNLFSRIIASSVQGDRDPARRRKKTSCLSAANLQKVSNTFVI